MRHGRAVLLLGALALALALFGPSPVVSRAALTTAVTLMAALLVAGALVLRHKWRSARMVDLVTQFIAHDSLPSFITGADGAIVTRNAAGQGLAPDAPTLAATLERMLASPAPLLFRVQSTAAARGFGAEDATSRRGHMRISATQLAPDTFLWRVEELAERGAPGRQAVGLPMLTIGRGGTILSMNDPARRLIGQRPRALDQVFTDLPLRPGTVMALATAHGRVRRLVAMGDGPEGRREVYLLPEPDRPEAPPDDKLFETLPVALMRLDARGTVLAANDPARDLLGDACIGQPLSALMEGLGRSISDWLADALQGHGARHREFLRLSRPDSEEFVQVSLHRATTEGDMALFAVLQDATEFKTLEAQFVQSQKMQAIGELAGGVAHDFNNLLTAISGHCDLLLLRHDQGDPDYADLVQINQNANRAAALVGQLLAFSRKQTLRPEVIDMRDTLSDLTHLLNRLVGEKITLSLMHDPTLRPLRVDKRQLEQVVMNLVVNARDAMPDGGEIRIETENVTLTQRLDRDRATLPPGDYVMVRISDDGCGIPEALRQKVFDPFFTTKGVGQGTGLGLSTVYGIVKQSGGFVFLDSVEGVGTSFTLYFPSHDGPVPPAPEHARPAAISPETVRGGVVLLVEDEAPVRAFAARALRLRGLTVIEAGSAEEALNLLDNPDLGVDVIVTDVVMPGLDGPSWVRKALEARPDTQVVFMSGYAEESFSDAQGEFPNSEFLPKPFSLADLTQTVQRHLR